MDALAVAITTAVVALGTALGKLIIDPDKASKWGAIAWRAFSFARESAHQKACKHETEARVNSFLHNALFSKLADANGVAVRIAWVRTISAPSLQSDGTIILRLRNESDPVRNCLATVSVALPHALCPILRPFINPIYWKVVDLEILRSFAAAFDAPALTIFATTYLNPLITTEPIARDYATSLQSVARSGLLENVLLQELVYLDHRTAAEPPVDDVTPGVLQLTEFVSWLGDRQPHDESRPLIFSNAHFHIAFLLLSKSATASQGIDPYVRRFGLNLAAGAESVYVMGLTLDQDSFCRTLVRRLELDKRVNFRRFDRIRPREGTGRGTMPFAIFRKRTVDVELGSFEEQLISLGYAPGTKHFGTVQRVQANQALVHVDSLRGIIKSSDIGWGYEGSVSGMLRMEEVRDFCILEINETRHELVLGIKQLSESPWARGDVPHPGDTVRIRVLERFDWGLSVSLVEHEGLFGRIHMVQLHHALPIGEETLAQVLEVDPDRDLVELSTRALVGIDWKAVTSRLTVGRRILAKVLEISRDGVLCQLEPGVTGFIPKEEMLTAGHELTQWRDTVVPGQQFEVVISRFQAGNARFSLRLARNVRQ